MFANFLVALQITAIGLSLVFAALFCLWGLMTLLVRVTAEKTDLESTPAEASAPAPATANTKLKAVAVATAIAHALQSHAPASPPTAYVSAWQAVMRARQLNQRGPRR